MSASSFVHLIYLRENISSFISEVFNWGWCYRYFWLSPLGPGDEGSTGSWGVEFKDIAKHPAVHRTIAYDTELPSPE